MMDVPLASLAIADATFLLQLELYQCRPIAAMTPASKLMDIMHTGRNAVQGLDSSLAAKALIEVDAFEQLREKCRMALIDVQAGRQMAVLTLQPVPFLASALLWLTLNEPSAMMMHRRQAIMNCMRTEKRVVLQIASTANARYVMAIDKTTRDMAPLLASMEPTPRSFPDPVSPTRH